MTKFPVTSEDQIGIQNQAIDSNTLNKLKKVNESRIKYIVKTIIKEVVTENNLEKLFSKYIDLPLECDGLTRVLSYILTRNNIQHKTCIGYISDKLGNRNIHYWIKLQNGNFIDYRAKMWLNNKLNIPNGVFDPKDYPDVIYKCKKEGNLNVNKSLFQILTS